MRRTDFTLAHTPGADFPPPEPSQEIHFTVGHVRRDGHVTIAAGVDACGRHAWIVTYCPPTGSGACGWTYDRREAEHWASIWPEFPTDPDTKA